MRSWKPWTAAVATRRTHIGFFICITSLSIFVSYICILSSVEQEPQTNVHRIVRSDSEILVLDTLPHLNMTGTVLNEDLYSCNGKKRSLRHCSAIIDLTCTGRLAHAFFHRVMDCFNIEYDRLRAALQSTPSLCLVGYANRANFYLAALPRHLPEPQFLCSETDSQPTVVAERNLSNATEPKSPTHIFERVGHHVPILKLLPSSASSYTLLEDLHARWGSTSQERKALILIQREGKTRQFSEDIFEKLKSNLINIAQLHNRTLYTYAGKETIDRTVEIFHSADLVIGFHGAAAANMLFAAQGACYIEISTYTKSDMSTKWRSNAESLKSSRPDLKTFTFNIPLDHGWPTLNTTDVDANENADGFIKSLTNITLQENDLDNLMSLVKYMLYDK